MEFATNRSFTMDEADYASELSEKRLEMLIKQARKPLRQGTPGVCDLCGRHSGRLIDGACAPCRDRFKLK
ncbi:hypothetical protein UFOVP1470_52 [uncultured Caudovirales phage]|uniref:Uncharacterized protein n=1 Tax=uncultured Caudovirales phage TaxID=2100421 RepID=A0A6J5QFZ9_9CAUD|nr:hypothetical protein UFOVP939_27 [uncultured Caudovirales phage]CAB4178594.1 hypothetical protein UFOVP1018_50 [uncultured Caudovirales phage]CAB4184323.1 hypothetical protein UFOVP1105_51 [uncultured Caudovirales phage]CAB4202847.1 hypothetical protein UFOVP1372_41 [uncultured Caudovirales phage]CAB4215061.1 hypothetical protein UFOVP1470_52 [uncultured Caudovirales phage]